jgi:hypothetical protein
MKRLLLVFAISVLCIAPALAQKGTWLWYGNLGGNSASSDAAIVNNTKTSIRTMDGIGYQFASHWHVGVQGSYGYSHSESYNGTGGLDQLKNDTWSAGGFLRGTVGKRLYAYMQLDFGWAGSRQKVNDIEVGKSNGFGLGLTPAVGVNLYHGWCLNLSFANISWNSTNPSAGTGKSVNTTDFVYNIGESFNFGISKIFGWRKAEACAKAAAEAAPSAPMMKK